MDNNLSTLADRLKAKLDGASEQNLVTADQDLVELMDVHLDAVSAAAAHLSGHASGHGSAHGSVGRELEADQQAY
ncbi:hypothetical protein [Archangium sp.]|uniref:hypothetical protein n=1 Tax=Archangium sp. TaxID=1872627 RepID=UPI00286B480D|nr:hypothetical protein [Archangium sp.]